MRNESIFQTVKAAVPVPQAAEAYGLTITRNHMTCCPFHPDSHPSMKLNEAYYYCFGCHETGDVIDFTAKLFHLTPVQAALKLAADFGIDPNTPAAACATYPRAAPAQQHKEVLACTGVLIDYERLLKRQKKLLAPASADAPMDDDFAQALHQLPLVTALIERLYDADKAIRESTARMLIESGMLDDIRQKLKVRATEDNDEQTDALLAA